MSEFTEQSVYIPTVTETYHIQVLRVDKVFKDGELISTRNHRHVLAPGSDLTDQDPVVVAVATAVWTPEVIEAYRATQEPELPPEPESEPEPTEPESDTAEAPE